MLRSLLIFLFFLGVSLSPITLLYSQSSTFSHQYFGVEEGLPSNLTSCIFKDSRGLIWIGTDDKGLCIYDGNLFQNYPLEIEEERKKVLLNNFMVRHISEDNLGKIWIATDKGLFVTSLTEKTTKLIPLPKNKKTQVSSCIFVSKGHNNRMYVIKENDGEIVVIDPNYNIDTTTYQAFKNIHELVEDKYGNLWYSSLKKEGFLYKIKKGERDSATVVLQLPKHFSFAKTQNGEVLLLQLINNTIHQIDPLGEKLSPYRDKEYQINPNTLTKLNKNLSNLNIYLQGQFFDSNGQVWLATEQGVYYVQAYKRKLPFQNIPILAGKSLRLISKHKDSLFYISTTQGFHELNISKNSLHQLHPNIDVTKMLQLSQDSVLLNITGANHFILDQKTKKVEELVLKNATRIDLYNTFTSIRTQDGRILSGGYQFIGLDSTSNISNCDQSFSFKKIVAHSFLKTTNDPSVIWVGTSDGLYKIDSCKIDHISVDPKQAALPINSLYQWTDDELIIGSTNDGIYHFHKEKGLLAAYNIKNGLSDNRIACIQSNDNKGIWVSTFNGLNYIDLQQKTVQSFYEKDGLTNNEFNRFSEYKSEEGDIWFGGVKGCTIIPKGLKIAEEVKYNLRVNSFGKIDKVSQLFNRTFLGLNNQTVILEPDEKYIEFHFGSSNLVHNKNMRYAYFLEGIDENWVYSDNNNRARYTNLDAGTYRFRAKMKTTHGGWQLSENWVDLEVQIYFYEKNWFRGLMLFLLISGIYSIAYYRLKQKRKVQELKEKLSRDLHDDVGSTLGGIHRIIQTLQEETVSKDDFNSKLNTIKKLSDNVVTNMKDVIWSISGENMTFGHLKNKILDFSDDVLLGSNIDFECTFEDIDTKQVLDFNSRYHLMMICKEGINNALKHNKGGELNLLFKNENGKFFLILENKFKILRKTKMSSSHGLQNMKLRAKSLKASFDIEAGEQYFRIVLKRRAF